MATSVHLERRLEGLGQGDHPCLLYDDTAEQATVIIPFLRAGLVRGERCVYVADQEAIRTIADAVTTRLDIRSPRDRQSLLFLTDREWRRREGLNPESLAAGFAGLRIAAAAPLTEVPGTLKTEARPTQGCFFPPNLQRSLTLCQYNRLKVSPRVMHAVLRDHPIVILGDWVCSNPYYTPSHAVGVDRPEEEDVRWMLAQITRMRTMEEDYAQLHATSEQHRREAESLAELGRLIAQSPDPEKLGQQVTESVRRLLAVDASVLFRLEAESGDLVAVAFSGDVGPLADSDLVLPRGTALVGLAVRERRPVSTRNLLTDPRITLTAETRARVERAPFRAALAVPLIAKDRVIGALAAYAPEGRVLDETRFLQSFADQAALALEIARLSEEIRHQRRETVAVEAAAREMASSFGKATAFQRIADRARDLLRCDLAFIASYDARAGAAAVDVISGIQTTTLRSVKLRPGKGICGRVLASGEPFITGMDDGGSHMFQDEASNTPEEFSQALVQEGIVAGAVVPLRFRDTITGLLAVAARRERQFTPQDLELLTKLAEQAAVAFENNRLHDKAKDFAVQQERIRVANELHDTLSQVLFSVALKLDWCLRRAPADSALRSKLNEIRQDTGFVMRQIRGLISKMADGDRHGLAFAERLRALIEEFRELTGLSVHLAQRGDPARLREQQQEVLQKSFQEALANVAKHARASRVTITLGVTDERVEFEVVDDGVGPPRGVGIATLASVPGHFGLRQMQERIEAIGGRLELERNVPSGFRLRGTLPVR